MSAISEEYAWKISQEFTWRQYEIIVARNATRNSKGQAKWVSAKSTIVLNYAHWEGFVKRAVGIYIECLRSLIERKVVKFNNLSTNIKVSALYSCYCRDNIWRESIYAFGENIRAYIEEERLSEFVLDRLVDAENNLKHRVLIKLLYIIGLDGTVYMSSKAFIDNRICELRNKVAHGDHEALQGIMDYDTFESTIDETLLLMRYIKNDMMNALVEERYKADSSVR